MLNNIFYNYIAGIIASFTPCVIVLIPLVLYRFFSNEKKQYLNFLIFITGFIFAYSVFALTLHNLLSSSIQNGIKIGLGIIFLSLGVLAITNKINPLKLPISKNVFLLGIIFALIVSTSPCTLPYLGVILTLSIKNIILNILFFSLGLITPAIVFLLIGKSILNITKKTGKIYSKLNKLMNLILIISGIYLIFNINSFNKYDLIPSIILLSISYFIIIKSNFMLSKKITLKNIFLLLALLGIILSTVIHCNHIIKTQKENTFNFFESNIQQNTEPVCNQIEECKLCQKCSILFFISATIGFLTIIISKKIK